MQAGAIDAVGLLTYQSLFYAEYQFSREFARNPGTRAGKTAGRLLSFWRPMRYGRTAANAAVPHSHLTLSKPIIQAQQFATPQG